MVRGAYALSRVAVLVRTSGTWLWWTGLAAAAAGAAVPGLTGRRIGLFAGLALFVVGAAVSFLVRQGRYRRLAEEAVKVPKAPGAVVLQDRAVTARLWLRSRRRWLLLALVAAVASSFLVPVAAGLLLAGLGAGLRFKAARLGRLESEHEVLLWVRPEQVRRGPAGKDVTGYETTGVRAGEAPARGGRGGGGPPAPPRPAGGPRPPGRF
ncbi:hypothetical protein ACFW9F_05120 [Streptomyces sp. NPDC059506]|uniref:hypothetical protein n=1 Tax=Streptomyces sp. NPDC059506 TaxID=3347751 RepID=UPI00369CE30F